VLGRCAHLQIFIRPFSSSLLFRIAAAAAGGGGGGSDCESIHGKQYQQMYITRTYTIVHVHTTALTKTINAVTALYIVLLVHADYRLNSSTTFYIAYWLLFFFGFNLSRLSIRLD